MSLESFKVAPERLSDLSTSLNNMENENRYLIFNKPQWQAERKARVWGFDWSDEEIENAIKSKNGKIGEKFGVDCYVTKDFKQL